MGYSIGLDAKLYRNTASWATPTWSEITIARDLTQNAERAEGELSARGDDFKFAAPGQADVSIEGELQYDPSDTNYAALRDAFLNRTTVELAAMDQAIATSGAEGWRADWYVTQFTRNEPMEEGVTVSFKIRPAKTANTPTWYEVP